ncbi:Aste57867_17051 [Aphanomyces stellatus]|uniref:Serine/threonine-protein phosphatase PGAM5, mitochondrial n=1 Tax=Aphanomyces stellatus TaxID=120398 RepID=A0A485L7N0_9STRA|nr:hypothetical protein As57867_016993 [Aphanomyces stellatus]VFT93812.1 Aste57867_17051 [Aphanomyces stellatus]
MGRNSNARTETYVKEGEVLRASFNSGSGDTLFDMLRKVVPHSRSPSAFDDSASIFHSGGGSDDDADMYDLKTFDHRSKPRMWNNKTKKRVTFPVADEDLCKVEWVAEFYHKYPETPLPYNLFGTRRDIGYEEEEQLLAPSWSKALPYSSVDFGCFQMQMQTRDQSFFVVGPVQIHHVTCMGLSWKTYWAGLSSGLIVFSCDDEPDQVFSCPIHKCRVQILDDTQLKLYEVAGLRDVDELFVKFPNSATLYMWFWAIQVAAATPLFSDTDGYTKTLRRLRAAHKKLTKKPPASSSFLSAIGDKLGLAKPVPEELVLTLPVTLRNPAPRDPLFELSPSRSTAAAPTIQRRILFIRHGEFHNVHFKTPDAEKNLTETGEEMARRTGTYIQDLIEEAGLTYEDVQLVYSTVGRTIQTMDLIAKEIDKAAGIYETFNPYETLSKKTRVARHEFALLRESVPHGLSGSKKFLCRSAKMALALQAICAGDALVPITVVICSSSFIRYCVHQAAYGVGFIASRSEMNQSIVIGHCSVTQIDVDSDNALLLRGVNQMSHLAGIAEYKKTHNPQEGAVVAAAAS